MERNKIDMLTSSTSRILVCTFDVEALNVAGLDNEEYYITRGDRIPERIAKHIGRVFSDGFVKSYLEEDVEDGTTTQLDKVRNTHNTYEKERKVIIEDGCESELVIDIFIMYEFKNHISKKPTVTDKTIDRKPGVEYKAEYEILLVADSEHKRYLNVGYTTQGTYTIQLYDVIRDLDTTLQEYAEGNKYGFSFDEESETYRALFFNDLGEDVYFQFKGIDQILGLINSVRLTEVEEVEKKCLGLFNL